MSRSNRLGGRSNVKGLLAGRLMETIVEDVIKAKAMPFAEWHALSPNPPVPLAIPVSWGWQYQETQAGVDAAHTLTRQTWKSREDLRQTIDRDAFAKLSFQGHGLPSAISPCIYRKSLKMSTRAPCSVLISTKPWPPTEPVISSGCGQQ